MNKQAKEILEIDLNNITCKLQNDQQQYFLLIKKQQSGDYCLMIITDYCENFWIKKITYDTLLDIKEELKIKTDVRIFVQHLITGIKQQCTIEQKQPDINLNIRMKISEGLIINCKIKTDTFINIDSKPSQFRTIMKIFGKQMYQAKQMQYKQLAILREFEQTKQQKNVKNNKQSFIPSAIKMMKQDQSKKIPVKHRDLINPIRKKRKGLGVRFRRSSDQEQDS